MFILTFYSYLYLSVLLHELGHFLTGFFFNVQILKFHVGSGPSVRFTSSNIKFEFGMFPTGGYVEFADQNETTKKPYESLTHSQNLLITAFGPLCNLMLFGVFFVQLMQAQSFLSGFLFIILSTYNLCLFLLNLLPISEDGRDMKEAIYAIKANRKAISS